MLGVYNIDEKVVLPSIAIQALHDDEVLRFILNSVRNRFAIKFSKFSTFDFNWLRLTQYGSVRTVYSHKTHLIRDIRYVRWKF